MAMKIKQEKVDSRAPPRRRARGDEMDEQPVFLRKAYAMTSSCPPEIGGWSDEGDAIVIKDLKQFAEKIIPSAYRHNNLASFVRQLNFYGFRKVKADTPDKANWWIFRHPNFLRGKPHLISEIRRAVHYAADSTGGKEVFELKDQVQTLSERLASLHDQVEHLTHMVSTMQVASGAPLSSSTPASGKKRRMATAVQPMPTSPTPAYNYTLAPPEFSRQPSFSTFDFDYFMELDQSGMDVADDLALPVPESPVSANAAAVQTVQEIAKVLNNLTPELRERFVDKLAETMGTQLASKFIDGQAPADSISPSPATLPLATIYEPIQEKQAAIAATSAPAVTLTEQQIHAVVSAALSAVLVANLRHLTHSGLSADTSSVMPTQFPAGSISITA